MKRANSNTLNTLVAILVLLTMLLAACAPAAEPAPIAVEPEQPSGLRGVEFEVPSEIVGGPVITLMVFEETDTSNDEFELTVSDGVDGNMSIVCKNGKVTVSVLKGGDWVVLDMTETANCKPETLLRYLEGKSDKLKQRLVDMGFTGEELANFIRFLRWYVDNVVNKKD